MIFPPLFFKIKILRQESRTSNTDNSDIKHGLAIAITPTWMTQRCFGVNATLAQEFLNGLAINYGEVFMLWTTSTARTRRAGVTIDTIANWTNDLIIGLLPQGSTAPLTKVMLTNTIISKHHENLRSSPRARNA